MTQLLDLGKLRFYFAGEWSSGTTYEINDIVKYGGNVYVYTYGLKTAANLPTDVIYWQLMVEGVKFEGVYANADSYQVGDGVSHGGKVYICVADTTGNTPPNAAYWSQFADGIQWEGVYSSVTGYQKNDVVLYGGSAYIAKQDSTNNLPSDTAFWERFAEGISYKSIYNAGTVYVEGDIVAYGGGLYKAIGDTTGNVPTNVTYWVVFQTGINPTGNWATATSYFPDDIVTYGGNSFKCLIAHASAAFAGDLGAIPPKWEKFISGVRYRGEWQAASNYVVDDIVKDGVSTYICLIDHTGGSSFSADVTAAKWEFFARGATDVLPIIGAADTGKSLTIAADGINYAWIGATNSNNVFYVAPHGTDTATAGRALATPFATIKYATTQCGTNAVIYVKNGTYEEQLPIVVPDTVAIIGDTQRNVLVQPAAGLSDDGVTNNNEAQMFQLSNGSILRNMTFNGMTGWVPAASPNADAIASSTAKGVCVALNPNTPITTKSPYVIDCTATGAGFVGAYVDGNVQASGNKSMLFHGYTVIADNGVGFWIANGAKAEIVSCFTYFCYFGYAADHGARIRALNGNNSYGTWGAVSVGFDQSETPLTGAIKGKRVAVLNISGTFNAGDTITGGTSGATAVLTNVQGANGFFYIKDITGTFQVGEALAGSSSGAADIDTNGVQDQQGFVIVADGFSEVPVPGRSIQFAGDTVAYVIQSVSGSYVDATSEIIIILAQEKATGSADNTAITTRAGFSQIRLTGHDFLSIGTGSIATTNYPGDPTQAAAQGNEIQENYPARVYYVSTDQDGNFRVGEYFRIEQATGTATLNANAFDLAGLTSLQLGSIGAQLGETINEFSSDVALSGSSNTAVPTENAVKTYVDAAVVSGANSPNAIQIVSGDITATLGKIYAVGGSHTITLPASPTAGDNLKVLDTSGSASTGNITIARNGNKIGNLTEDFLIDVDNASVNLTYINSTYGWGVL